MFNYEDYHAEKAIKMEHVEVFTKKITSSIGNYLNNTILKDKDIIIEINIIRNTSCNAYAQRKNENTFEIGFTEAMLWEMYRDSFEYSIYMKRIDDETNSFSHDTWNFETQLSSGFKGSLPKLEKLTPFAKWISDIYIRISKFSK